MQFHGGPLGFGQILLRGVLGVVRKSRRLSFFVLLHFYNQTFQTFSLPPPPSPPPLPRPPCASMHIKHNDSKVDSGYCCLSIASIQTAFAFQFNAKSKSGHCKQYLNLNYSNHCMCQCWCNALQWLTIFVAFNILYCSYWWFHRYNIWEYLQAKVIAKIEGKFNVIANIELYCNVHCLLLNYYLIC